MTIEELNEKVDTGDIDEFIRVCEARQHKALSKLADTIAARSDVKMILLAGASSAGKTTTAKRLGTQLRVDGIDSIYLSTDDYFVGHSRNPKDENGDWDYETIECVDMEQLAKDMNTLFDGEAIHPRKYDFVKHEGYFEDTLVKLPKGGIVILEGLHALNPRLVEGVAGGGMFRIFIEPKTQLEVFASTRLTPRLARLLRRLVRDNQFRKMDPAETFTRWPKVVAGEEKWINPFRPNADAEFDSGLEYELAVLKPFAMGHLEMAKRKLPDEGSIYTLLTLLSAVHATDPTKVPGDSILRETIGGSQLEY
ncbi:MAG: nucleoside kinase [Kiritimatiellae bacterium]|nr:nucleoside kinase [Kiritimatiellia bacterium]